MEFTFSDEQQELQRTVASWLERRLPSSRVRELAESDEDFPSDLWQEMVDLGWVGLLVPERLGGSGMGLVDVVVVLEEMGRLPTPGPFLSSAVLATIACRRLGLDERLSAMAAGNVRGTVAIDEAGHGDVVDRIRTRAVRKHGQWLLTGHKLVVLDGDSADFVLVAARTQAGVGTFVIEAPRCEVVPTWDVCRTVGRLPLDHTPAEPVGPAGDHTAIWRRVVDDGSVALCAEMLGGMEQAQDLAVEYAKVRVQFDRPIATFQAIKHKAADMLHRVELARVGTHYAAWTSDVDAAARGEAAAMAKAYCGEAAIAVTGECIQIHGGVGFTWQCDAHLHYRRAKQNDLLLGSHGTWLAAVGDSFLATV